MGTSSKNGTECSLKHITVVEPETCSKVNSCLIVMGLTSRSTVQCFSDLATKHLPMLLVALQLAAMQPCIQASTLCKNFEDFRFRHCSVLNCRSVLFCSVTFHAILWLSPHTFPLCSPVCVYILQRRCWLLRVMITLGKCGHCQGTDTLSLLPSISTSGLLWAYTNHNPFYFDVQWTRGALVMSV